MVTFRAPIVPTGKAPGSSEKSTEKTGEKSSEKILDLVRRNPAVSAREMADVLGLTSRAVEKQVSKLRKDARIRRVGPDKGGRWEVLS